MTTEIPKLPTKERQPTISYTDRGGLAWAPLAYYDHEHAVARVAVEALRRAGRLYGACSECGYSDEDVKAGAGEHADYCKIGAALAKIEASGWLP